MTTNQLEEEIKKTPFLFRPQLTIPKNINFGLEIELEDIDFDIVESKVKKQFGESFKVKTDKSLRRDHNAEIVTSVLRNTKETWIMLKKLTKLIQVLQPHFDNCSFQINYDASLLPTIEDKVRFLKLFAVYEDIIYRFSKGEDEHYRDSIDEYASPIILQLKGYMNIADDRTMVEMFTHHKRHGINFKKNPKELIEFRTPNSTHNIVLWQNYITTFYYLLKLAANPKFSRRELDEYINKFCHTYLLEIYEIEDIEKAQKLSDMLFHNSIDKTYFMKQYIGLNK